jgi:hypothetical protein
LEPLRFLAYLLGLLLLEAVIFEVLLAASLAFAFVAGITIFVGGTIAFLRRPMYSFDDQGLHKGDTLLLNWADVKLVETVYYNHSWSHTFWISGIPQGRMAVAVLLSSPEDQLIPKATTISYGVSLVFHDRQGRTFVVHSNLGKVLERQVPEMMKEAVEARRLGIEFTTSTVGNPTAIPP